MIYRLLTAGERYPIQALVGKQCTVREIAAALGRDKGPVRRELRRNRGGKGYRPQQSQALAEIRRPEAHNAREVPPETWAADETMHRQEHSLEEVSGRRRRRTGERISHEALYQHLCADKRAGGNLH